MANPRNIAKLSDLEDGSGNLTSAGTVKASTPFYLNPTTVDANYTIPAATNAMTIGPIEIADGVTVEIPSDGSWSIV